MKEPEKDNLDGDDVEVEVDVKKTEKKVPASFDAWDWANEFNDVLVSHNEQPIDPGFIMGWFANALMRGYDEKDKEWHKWVDECPMEIFFKQASEGRNIADCWQDARKVLKDEKN